MKRTANNELIEIGMRIKEIRTRRNLTLAETSKRAGLSAGLLSKIENFRTLPSLPVLTSIARALETDMADIVRGIGHETKETSYILTKAGERERINRDNAVGFSYESLGSRYESDNIIEAFTLTITPESKRQAVTTDGEQFLFLLKGEIDFEYGRETIHIGEGDALFFDGRIPHRPFCRKGKEAVLLALYILNNKTDQ